jgi:hypothetical protein
MANVKTGTIELPDGKKIPMGTCTMSMIEDFGLINFSCEKGLNFTIRLRDGDWSFEKRRRK